MNSFIFSNFIPNLGFDYGLRSNIKKIKTKKMNSFSPGFQGHEKDLVLKTSSFLRTFNAADQ